MQFVAGTTLEQAHETAHRLQDAIATRIPGADVLIHLEPEDRVTARYGDQSRLIAALAPTATASAA